MTDDVLVWLTQCAENYERYPGEVSEADIRDNVYRAAIAEIERLRAKLHHAYDIGHFSICKKCGMPMCLGCICEACGWNRTVSDE
jgi:RNA polymerase-binding transcription factor DksA